MPHCSCVGQYICAHRHCACRDVAKLMPGATMAAQDRTMLACHEIPKSTHVLMRKALNAQEANSTIHVYLQLGPTTQKRRALQLLCEQVTPSHNISQGTCVVVRGCM